VTETINYDEDVREGGTVSVIGVYGGFMQPLLERIQPGRSTRAS
jgi:hypothetical protein